MMRNMHPAEELFELRAEIRALRAREAELRDYFLGAAAGDDRIGPHHQVAVSTQRQRKLDHTALPETILADPRHWTSRETRIVKVLRRATAQVWDGFAAPAPQLWLAPPGGDPDPLFEPFV